MIGPEDMAVPLSAAKAHLNMTLNEDDDLILWKIVAAQSHLEGLLGFRLVERYPSVGDVRYPATVPWALRECVALLAAHWYENRESVLVGVTGQSLPIGVDDVVANFRDYSWAD